MNHSELPDAILHEYPDLKLDDLKQNCWGVYYHYKTEKYGIVGGYDFDFFIYRKSSRKKFYFGEQTCQKTGSPRQTKSSRR